LDAPGQVNNLAGEHPSKLLPDYFLLYFRINSLYLSESNFTRYDTAYISHSNPYPDAVFHAGQGIYNEMLVLPPLHAIVSSARRTGILVSLPSLIACPLICKSLFILSLKINSAKISANASPDYLIWHNESVEYINKHGSESWKSQEGLS
jgi:hypothetical protein